MRTLYECEKCGGMYETEAEALECENQEDDVLLKVGDIVLAGAGYGWFNDDKRWVANPEVIADWKAAERGDVCTVDKHPDHGNCFQPCCTLQFYYVVTAIDERYYAPGEYYEERGVHRTQYHLFTKAMKREGDNARHSQGYTYNEGHVRPTKVENPPELDTEDLIGRKAERLL